jgi:hypothetical protein
VALPPFARAALLLDLDGTLLDIAATPDAVVVPPELPDTLRTLRLRLDGALHRRLPANMGGPSVLPLAYRCNAPTYRRRPRHGSPPLRALQPRIPARCSSANPMASCCIIVPHPNMSARCMTR